jgi:Bacterial TniB protein
MFINEFSTPTPKEILAAQQVNNVVVQHDAVSRIMNHSLEVIFSMQSLKMPMGILIQAEPGMGKSLLLQLIRSELNNRLINKAEKRCLSIELDSTVDTHKIASLFTYEVGHPMLPARPTLEQMNLMVFRGLDRIKPIAATIDEMQHVCEGNRDITARAVTDWLKVRMDKFNFPLICAGTHAIARLCEINDQFTSRASANYVINPFTYGTQWMQVLASFATSVKLVDLSIITKSGSKKLHIATKGNMRALKRVLVFASRAAATRPDPIVSMSDLELAYQQYAGDRATNANPFQPKQEK